MMHIFKMRGAWSASWSFIFDVVVARGTEPVYERIAGRMLPELEEGSRVLEVGCGTGFLACLIARKRPDLRVTATDLSDYMVGRARRRCRGIASVNVEKADALDLPFHEAEFDTALSVASIKHWPDRQKGVSEMVRVVRPGGRVLVLEAGQDCTREQAREFTANFRYVMPGFRPLLVHYFRQYVAGQGVTLDELSEIGRRAGLEELQCRREEGTPALSMRGRKAGKAA